MFTVNAVANPLNAAKAEGRLHTVSEGPITGLGEGWWLLPHTMKKHPELKTVVDVLKRPDLFPHPEVPGTATTCVSWGPQTMIFLGNIVFCLMSWAAKTWVSHSIALSLGLL